MSFCDAATNAVVAPAPQGWKGNMNDKLLGILVNDANGADLLGLNAAPAPTVSSAEVQDESSTNNLIAELSRGCATEEAVEEQISKNRSRFLVAVAVGVLCELFLLSMTISPFHTSGFARALAQTLTNLNSMWRLTIILRGIYVATLTAYSCKAYFTKGATSNEWRNVQKIALAGMILELFFTLLVKRLNIISFATRGMIAFYSTILAALAKSTTGEYAPVDATPDTV